MARFTGRLFVLYDGREQTAGSAGVENAPILATAISEPKARELSHWFHARAVTWYEYSVVEGRIIDAGERLDLLVA